VKSSAPADPAPVRRLAHFTPLRYPGGKGKLAAFVKSLIERNALNDGEYAEPYAGGAAIGLELLFQEYVAKIHINDISRPLYAFWKSVLDHTDELSRLVRNTPLTVRSWDKQKRILANYEDHDDLSLGFATFFLNRTNRSGILNGGIIGGRDQSGPWKIDARFNRHELVHRIEAIARLRRRIILSREDAYEFLSARLNTLPKNSLIYLDPPYYVKGKALYYDYYIHEDHVRVAKLMTNKVRRQRWIVSYDNVAAVRKMYPACRRLVYKVGYSAREVRDGSEVMFFCDHLDIPPPTAAMRASALWPKRIQDGFHS
jgi:DNA adenine methylase